MEAFETMNAHQIGGASRGDTALIRLAASVVVRAIEDLCAGRFLPGEDEVSVWEWLSEGPGAELVAELGLYVRSPADVEAVIERHRQTRQARSKQRREALARTKQARLATLAAPAAAD